MTNTTTTTPVGELAELLTLDNLRAWLAGRPARETYRIRDCKTCPVACFLHDNGYPFAKAFNSVVALDGDAAHKVPWGNADVPDFIFAVDLNRITHRLDLTRDEAIAIIDQLHATTKEPPDAAE